ncbi:hypothetical protein RCL1_008367 [Eukaryota sp. TZLM3-RCL]
MSDLEPDASPSLSLTLNGTKDIKLFFRCLHAARCVGSDTVFHFTPQSLRIIVLPEGSQEAASQIVIRSNIGPYVLSQLQEQYAFRIFSFDNVLDFLRPLMDNHLDSLCISSSLTNTIRFTITMFSETMAKHYTINCIELDKSQDGSYVNIPFLQHLEKDNKAVIISDSFLPILNHFSTTLSLVYLFIFPPASGNPCFLKSHLPNAVLAKKGESKTSIRLEDEIQEVQLTMESAVLGLPLKLVKNALTVTEGSKSAVLTMLFDEYCQHAMFLIDFPNHPCFDVCFMMISDVEDAFVEPEPIPAAVDGQEPISSMSMSAPPSASASLDSNVQRGSHGGSYHWAGDSAVLPTPASVAPEEQVANSQTYLDMSLSLTPLIKRPRLDYS